MKYPISIFIVDDHKMFTQSFEAFIRTQNNFAWKGCGEGTKKTIQEIIHLQPCVVIIDYYLTGINGFDVYKELKERGFKGKSVLLTMNREPNIKNLTKTLGFDGFANKNADGIELLFELEALIKGDQIYFELCENLNKKEENPFNLTKQEKLIINLICSGLSSLSISKKLNISIHTVYTHRRRILEKCGAENFMEVCRKAY